MIQEEIWKDVPNYVGHYEVSNLGNVKSLKFGKEKILSHLFNQKGYHQVILFLNGKYKNIKVHQLVASAFLNHEPNGNKIIVDHIDNDKNNNKLNNLQLITTRENNTKDRRGYTSDYPGVCWHKAGEKWTSQIHINGKKVHLGSFDDEILAAEAYNERLDKLNE